MMPLGAFRINSLAKFTVVAAGEVIRRKVAVRTIADAKISTAQSQFGGSSAIFDGTGDYLEIPNSARAIGTGPFTIDYWFRATSTASTPALVDLRFGGGDTTGYSDFINSTGKLVVFMNNASRITSTTTISTNTWYHVAIVRDSSNDIKMYINGTNEGSAYNFSNNMTSTYYRIGNNVSASNGFNGHIDELRISNTARYTSNFTPSTTAFVNDANTLLLLHMDGTNNSTVFEDDNGVRAKVGITAIGNAQVDTAQSKFGGASALFDGTNDYLRTFYNTNFTGDFTIECWARFNSIATLQTIWQFGNNSTDAIQIFMDSTAGANQYKIRLDIWNVAGVHSSSTVTTNTWYHFAVVRSGSTVTLYINGSSNASLTRSQTIGNGGDFYIGARQNEDLDFNGWIDEFRISNIARYTAAFTAPTAPFTDDANTLLLVHMDGTDGSTYFEDDNGVRAKVGITAIGNAQVDTAQSNFGGASALFDGTGDYLDTNHSFSWHSVSAGTIEFFVRLNSTAPFAQGLFSQCIQGAATGLQLLTVNNRLFVYKSAVSGNSYEAFNQNLVTGQFYHIAIVKESSTTVKFYVDGTLRHTDSSANGYTDSSANFWIGRGFGLSSNLWDGTRYDLNGWIDELRISNIARYTANFTPSTTPFQNDSNTLLLLHMDGTDASTVFTDDNGVTPDHDYGA
jgi:hypothetical protein